MLQRTGFKRKTVERRPPVLVPIARAHSSDPISAPPVEFQKPEKAKPGKAAPTVAEKAWMNSITEIGCIACLIDGFPGTPGAVHHLLRGGRRIGHMHTICLCDPGHHQNGDSAGKISRHPWKTRFEEAYGSEESLLERTKAIVALK